MGQLVSGVAHEINNPVAIISGFAQTLLLDELKSEHREMLQMMYDEATRIGRITSNLLAFARAGSKQRALVDMNDIARRTSALRSYHLSTLNIAVSLDLDPSEPKIWADASELQQLILNLLINAEQALVTVEGPRTIDVRTRATRARPDSRSPTPAPGSGRDPEQDLRPVLHHQPEGVGTGLGLSICYGIAREHGGRLWVSRSPGTGRASGSHSPATRARNPRPSRRHRTSRRPPANSPCSWWTTRPHSATRYCGFSAAAASEVRASLTAPRRCGVLQQRDFDVIISDVRMPGMSGRELLERLQRDRPDLVRASCSARATRSHQTPRPS